MRLLLICALLLPACGGQQASSDAGAADAAPADALLQADVVADADALPPDAPPPLPVARVKLSVEKDGIYRVTGKDLSALGLDLSGVKPRELKLLNLGQEVPIHVSGGDDGALDSKDEIIFFGEGIARDDPTFVYTEASVYWLVFTKGDGLRMAKQDGTPSGTATVPAAFERVLHEEEDTFYWQSLPNGKGQDHWFWGKAFYKGKQDYSFNAHNLYTNATTAKVRVNVRGRSATSAKPDHHTRVYLNGQQISDKTWDGKISFTHDEKVSAALLKEGSNLLSLESVGDTSASIDVMHFNWFEITYWTQFEAIGDVSDFSYAGSGAAEFSVSGFSSSDLVAYDVSDPQKPARLVIKTAKGADGTHTARFEQSLGKGTARYVVLTRAKIAAPAAVSLHTPAKLKDPQNGADHIFIVYDPFASGVQPLVKIHKAAGHRTMVARLSDVYAEFSHGIATPQAIRDFLTYAYKSYKKPAPLYVTLVGDTTVDYKDNFASSNISYVPTYLVETASLGQTPSDNWFACVDGNDLLPDMFIGRLSVQSNTELAAVVDKIVAYHMAGSAAWNSTVIFAADDNDPEFETLSDKNAASYKKKGYTPKSVYIKSYKPAAQATTELLKQLDSGALITQYIGHGMTTSWAGNLFDNDDVPKLQNGGKLSFVIALSCLTGFFPLPLSSWTPQAKQTCLAEKLQLEPKKGAVAVFASAGLEDLVHHLPIANGFHDAFLDKGKKTVGEATTRALLHAKTNGSSQDAISGYVLFGDPATRLKAVH